MALVPISEYAKKHNKARVSVRQKAERGGFKTAVKIGSQWYIDEFEEYIKLPTRRTKTDK